MVASVRPVGEEWRRTDRREAILQAATELFAERGYAGVTVQEIADVAGTHKTTVLYHFATKEALHEAVLDRALGRMTEVMREFLAGPLLRERVAYLLDQILAFYAANPALARLLQRELLETDGSEAYLRRFVDPIYLPAVASMERAMRDGLIRRVDLVHFIHDTHVALIGYFCHRPLLERLQPGVDPYSVESLIARREYLVDLIFRHIAPDEATLAKKRPARTKKGGR